MQSKQFLQRLAADVTKRCGICQATVEQVLPAVFDEIRFRLVEGKYPCVPIDSFGTFAVVNIPEREYHYNRPSKNIDEWRHKDATRRLKFTPTSNMKREMDLGLFDSSRKSFTKHPKDPVIRKRSQMSYRADHKGKVYIGSTVLLSNKQKEENIET